MTAANLTLNTAADNSTVTPSSDSAYLDFTKPLPVKFSLHPRTHELIASAAARGDMSFEDFVILAAWEKTRDILSVLPSNRGGETCL